MLHNPPSTSKSSLQTLTNEPSRATQKFDLFFSNTHHPDSTWRSENINKAHSTIPLQQPTFTILPATRRTQNKIAQMFLINKHFKSHSPSVNWHLWRTQNAAQDRQTHIMFKRFKHQTHLYKSPNKLNQTSVPTPTSLSLSACSRISNQ